VADTEQKPTRAHDLWAPPSASALLSGSVFLTLRPILHKRTDERYQVARGWWRRLSLLAFWVRGNARMLRDGNGYPKPEYPMGFTRYEGGCGMISLPAGMLMGKNFYPLGRRVWVRVGTTRTRLPMGKIYPHQYNYNHLIEHILAKIKLFSSYHLSRYHVM
jgi:hypothetical protein